MDTQAADDLTVTALVTDAIAAPSMHNAQPWRFRCSPGCRTLQVWADPERALPQADPDGRALHIGCGAALFNLRVSAAHAGLPVRTTLLPDPDRPGLLASVELAPEGEADGGIERLRRLHPAVHERHTSRYPFEETGLSAAQLTGLRHAAEQEGAALSFPVGWHLQLVLELAEEGEERDRTAAAGEHDAGTDPLAGGAGGGSREQGPVRPDLAEWTRTGAEAESAVDGVPAYAFGPKRRGGRAPVRDFAAGAEVPGRESAAFESHPHLALLSTERDRPVDWLRAGQAMQRTLLAATLEGLSSSFVTQSLEWPELRWPLREPVSGHGLVQMVLRFGYGPRGTATPRRPVEEVLEFDPA
ncbi:nitroreductase [Streptomyces sp. Ru73]|uniref:nitroreductase n=1 Tax=Streptomyces sp. Ru73 TaxID=2080748 RepID=UPI000CDDE74E|nr:nitroreductase [Streptomyces sp. Ru73]POX36361.1 nitroreductase [Streptomyces sp. Ru73]